MATEMNPDSLIVNTKDVLAGDPSSVSDEASFHDFLRAAAAASSPGGEVGGDLQLGLQEMDTAGDVDSSVDSEEKGGFQENVNVCDVETSRLESLSMLEVKKQQLLKDLDDGSIFGEMGNPAEKALRLEDFSEIVAKTVAFDGNELAGSVGEIDEHYGVDGSIGGSLKIELIDDTALIEPFSGVVPGIGNVNSKKARRTRRKGKGAKKVPAAYEYSYSGDGGKRVYSREEMLGMRFVGVVHQKRLWREIFDGLGTVAKEYAGLVNSKPLKQRNSFSPNILGEECCKQEGIELESTEANESENVYFPGPASSHNVSGGAHYTNIDQEFEADSYDSDEYYSTIQRPAFAVEGEPNFDAGSPEDGLEYLRRVRWEAARMPKVKVAKLDQNKLNKEQTAYMPAIPDIVKCPQHLMPTKEWEEAFLADFAKLRTALSQADASKVETCSELQPIFVAENADYYVTTEDAHPHYAESFNEAFNLEPEEEENIALPIDSPSFDVLGADVSPTLSLILEMDSVSRVSKLKKRVAEFENMTLLSKEDCVWLFALCAAIDIPLHAETCASVRSLLRKCARLRADKAEMDNEVIMLNILATISGRYFGQSDRAS